MLATFILLFLASCFTGYKLLKRNGGSALAFLLILTAFFFHIPIFFWFFDRNVLSYSLLGRVATSDAVRMSYVETHQTLAIYVAFLSLYLIGLALVFSRIRIRSLSPSRYFLGENVVCWEIKNKLTYKFLLIGFFTFVMFRLASYGADITTFFLPRYDDERAFGNVMVQRVFFGLGLTLLGIETLKSDFKINFTQFSLLVVMLLFAMASAQRREVFTVIGFYLSLRLLGYLVHCRSMGVPNVVKPALAVIGLAFAMLGMWYLRVLTTSETSTLDSIMGIRSPAQVFFGSIATGFPSLILIHEYVQLYGYQYLSPLHVLILYIPRFIWRDKPIVFSDRIFRDFGLDANPSVFLFGELWGSFGIFSFIPLTLIVLMLVVISRAWVTLKPASLIISAFTLQSMFLLFKNGFVGWGFQFSFFLLMSLFVLLFIGMKKVYR